jgi:hypothetical protein
LATDISTTVSKKTKGRISKSKKFLYAGSHSWLYFLFKLRQRHSSLILRFKPIEAPIACAGRRCINIYDANDRVCNACGETTAFTLWYRSDFSPLTVAKQMFGNKDERTSRKKLNFENSD